MIGFKELKGYTNNLVLQFHKVRRVMKEIVKENIRYPDFIP